MGKERRRGRSRSRERDRVRRDRPDRVERIPRRRTRSRSPRRSRSRSRSPIYERSKDRYAASSRKKSSRSDKIVEVVEEKKPQTISETYFDGNLDKEAAQKTLEAEMQKRRERIEKLELILYQTFCLCI